MPMFTKLISSITGNGNNNRTSTGTPSPLLPSSTYDPKNGRSNLSSYSNSNSQDKYHTAVCNKVNSKQPLLVTVAIESPPIIIYGHPTDSSGAFFSGTFILDIFLDNNNNNNNNKLKKPDTNNNLNPSISTSSTNLEPMMSVSKLSPNQLNQQYIIVKNVTLYLIQTVKYGKPFIPDSNTLNNCSKCTKKITELARWDILSKKTAFAKGSSHSCPFSYILPGSLPPTTILSNMNTSIKYELICMTTYVDPKSNKDQLINLSQPIKISRSILREQDRNSTRIFPPTDVSSTAVIPNVVYPRSTFPVEIRLDHVSTSKRRWRMRKLNWRLEECISVKSNHCDKHNEKFKSIYETMKKQKKSLKTYKNSGGVGRANINYYFEVPKSQLNNNNSSIPNRNSRNNENREYEDLYSNQSNLNSNSNSNGNSNGNPSQGNSQSLIPQASNWSVSASPVNSNIQSTNSNSLDQILASSHSNTPNNQRLGNPDEVVVPITNKEEIYIEEIRAISSGELKSGWKSDFSGLGRIELVVEISLMNLISMGINNTIQYKGLINSQTCNSKYNESYEDSNSGCNCSIDVEDPELGISVTHNLILEIVIAEELMQSTLASSNHNLKAARQNNSSISAASIVTGNIHSQSRVRLPSPASSSSQSITSNNNSNSSNNSNNNNNSQHRTVLTENDFPDDRVGPEPLTGNKSDVSNHMQGIPTGVARVLRMQFKVILSERSGFGVAWDDEVPPTYHAVGALSPPTYDQAKQDAINSPTNQDLAVPLDDNSDIVNIANLKI